MAVNPVPAAAASSRDWVGRVVLVTGGARRIGAAIVRQLHAAGAHVALHYRQSAAAADRLAAELNAQSAGTVACFCADLLDAAAVPALVADVHAHFGRLDALVNNASSFYPTPLGQIDAAAWDELVGSNFRAPLLLAQAAAPHLKANFGCVVNITDIHAERPLAGYPLYSAAKGALLTLTRALAIELAPEVRVNAVAPGAILWPEEVPISADEQRAIVEHTLLKRAGSAEEVARVVHFLLEASYVTGQVINVDGGRTAHL